VLDSGAPLQELRHTAWPPRVPRSRWPAVPTSTPDSPTHQEPRSRPAGATSIAPVGATPSTIGPLWNSGAMWGSKAPTSKVDLSIGSAIIAMSSGSMEISSSAWLVVYPLEFAIDRVISRRSIPATLIADGSAHGFACSQSSAPTPGKASPTTLGATSGPSCDDSYRQ